MDTPEEKKPVGYADDNQINAWKAKHNLKYIPEIIVVDEDGKEHVSYVRKPKMDQIQMLADHAKKNQEIKGLGLMFNTLRLGGSQEVMDEKGEMYLATISATGLLFKQQEAKVKKR